MIVKGLIVPGIPHPLLCPEAKAAVLGHLSIGDGTRVGVASAVTSDVEPGSEVTGIPAIQHARWRRAATAFGDLDQLTKTVRKLEKRIAQLEDSP